MIGIILSGKSDTRERSGEAWDLSSSAILSTIKIDKPHAGIKNSHHGRKLSSWVSFNEKKENKL